MSLVFLKCLKNRVIRLFSPFLLLWPKLRNLVSQWTFKEMISICSGQFSFLLLRKTAYSLDGGCLAFPHFRRIKRTPINAKQIEVDNFGIFNLE